MNGSQGQATRTQDRATLYWPSSVSRVLLLALQEVVGQHMLDVLLDRAGLPPHASDRPPSVLDTQLCHRDVGRIMQALEDVHGTRLATEVGRAGFHRGRDAFGALFGLADLDRRLLPLRIKLGAGLDAIASVFGDIAGQQVRVDGEADRFVCTVEHCPACCSRRADAPCCHAVCGLLEGLVSWVGGSTRYRVQETACIAAGAAACRFVIADTPPDKAPPDRSGTRR